LGIKKAAPLNQTIIERRGTGSHRGKLTVVICRIAIQFQKKKRQAEKNSEGLSRKSKHSNESGLMDDRTETEIIRQAQGKA